MAEHPLASPTPPAARAAPSRLATWLLWLLLVCLPSSSFGAASGEEPQQTVVVRRGDTLVKIAKRHGLKVEDLRKWNRGRVGKGDAIKAGDELVVKPGKVVKTSKGDKKSDAADKKGDKKAAPAAPAMAPPGTWEDHVVVRRGDSVSGIAARARVDVDALLQWNGLSARSKIRAGERLRVFRPGPRPTPQSVGRPTAGTLSYGAHLGEGPGYRLRFPKNAYGVDGVLKTVKTCTRRVKEQLPGSHDILVGDISRPGGGRFPPHSSHQSGRDVDIGYYLASKEQNATMHRVGPSEVDVQRTWALMKCLVTADKVVRFYVDKKIQHAMVAWMRDKRVLDDKQLVRLFEVEGGENALIQHAPKHDTHLHVRFACDADQTGCEEEEADAIFSL